MVRGGGLGTSVASEAMAGVPPDPARFARASDPGLGRRVSVEVERTVDAPMERVWALLRDYRVARPRLLGEHFSGYGVRERGEGARSVPRASVRSVGRSRGRWRARSRSRGAVGPARGGR